MDRPRERGTPGQVEPPAPRPRRAWLRSGTLALAAFYAALALGVAAKGPMGLVPALIVVAWLLTEKGVPGLPARHGHDGGRD